MTTCVREQNLMTCIGLKKRANHKNPLSKPTKNISRLRLLLGSLGHILPVSFKQIYICQLFLMKSRFLRHMCNSSSCNPSPVSAHTRFLVFATVDGASRNKNWVTNRNRWYLVLRQQPTKGMLSYNVYFMLRN